MKLLYLVKAVLPVVPFLGMAISTQKAVAAEQIPYETDFRQSTEGWAAVDNNGDGYTWKTDFLPDYGVYMEQGWYAPHNDDFISPVFLLEHGVEYNIKTLLAVMMPYGSDVVKLMVSCDGGAFSEVMNLTTTKNDPQTDETVFVPEADGEYRFSFRNITQSSYSPYVSVYSFAISKEDKPADDSFATDFSGDNPLDGWTVVDANNDNASWQIIDDMEGVVYDTESAPLAADDWLISPALTMKEGSDYLVTYTLAQASAFSEDLVEVWFGDGPTADGMKQTLATEKLFMPNGNGTLTNKVRVSCETAGSYHVGFHILTAEVNGTVAVTALEVIPADKPVPAPVAGLTVATVHKDGMVTLNWTNPTRDTDGALLRTMDIRIYADGTLVDTLSDRNPGEDDTFTYSPQPFTGDVVYSVAAVAGDNESEMMSETVCLDDLQGELVLVESKRIYGGEPEGWVIVNNLGVSGWRYDMGTYYFQRKLGSRPEEDDWLISPSFNLEPGKRYVVRYSLATKLDAGATFDVTIGDSQAEEAHQRVVQSHVNLKQNGLGDFQSRQFDVDASGAYHVGFHVKEVGSAITLAELEVHYINDSSSSVDLPEADYPVCRVVAGNLLIVEKGIASLDVYDTAGRMVEHVSATDATTADLSHLAAGLYIVHVLDKDGNAGSVKFAK